MSNRLIPWDDPAKFSIAKLLGDPLVEDYDQHSIIGIIGKTGTGKSIAALRIAYDISRYLSTKKGGKPEDYFSLDNIAIITKDEIIRVLKIVKQFGIYIYDDIGVGWGQREWQTKGNKIMNNIAMTFRTQRTVLILTVPDDEYIDKVPRNLLQYRIDMTESNFKLGFTLGRFQSLIRLYKYKKNIFPYVINPATQSKYVRAIFTLPPDEYYLPYKARRDTIQKDMQKRQIEELQTLFVDEQDSSPQITIKERVVELARDVNAGVYSSLKEACNKNGINYSYALNIKSEKSLIC